MQRTKEQWFEFVRSVKKSAEYRGAKCQRIYSEARSGNRYRTKFYRCENIALWILELEKRGIEWQEDLDSAGRLFGIKSITITSGPLRCEKVTYVCVD